MSTRGQQTLRQAVYLAYSGKNRDLAFAAGRLAGLPEGGWPETTQALREVEDYLPLRSQRAYTLAQFVAALYRVEGSRNAAGRYRTATDDEIRREFAAEVAS